MDSQRPTSRGLMLSALRSRTSLGNPCAGGCASRLRRLCCRNSFNCLCRDAIGATLTCIYYRQGGWVQTCTAPGAGSRGPTRSCDTRIARLCHTIAWSIQHSERAGSAWALAEELTLSPSVRRFKFAGKSTGRVRFECNDAYLNVIAFEAFEGRQIGSRTTFDPCQHHAALTFWAARPFSRKQ